METAHTVPYLHAVHKLVLAFVSKLPGALERVTEPGLTTQQLEVSEGEQQLDSNFSGFCSQEGTRSLAVTLLRTLAFLLLAALFPPNTCPLWSVDTFLFCSSSTKRQHAHS